MQKILRICYLLHFCIQRMYNMSQPVRVLHIIGSMTNGGAESFIMNQYRNIDRTKVQFDFLTTREGEFAFNQEIRDLGGKIYVIKSPAEQGMFKYIKDTVRIIKADRRIKALHAHVLYSCGISVFAAALAGLKIRISHSHNTKKYTDGGIKRKLYERVMRGLILTFSTDYFACGNEAGVNLYGKRFLKSRKSKFIPNSIDIKRFAPVSDDVKSALKQEFNIPNGIPVYTNIGRFVDQKNHVYQLEIIRSLKGSGHDFRYLMVGQGEHEQIIKQQAKQLGIDDCIVFTGPRQDIPAILSITDAFVLPSLFEGLPVTAIEAQAAGVPCLCADNITRQADIGLDMINYIGIDKNDVEKWRDACINCKDKSAFDRSLIEERLKQLSFDSKSGAEYLCSVYTR